VTETNEMYVAVQKVQSWLDAGYDEQDCLRLWNSGTTQERIGTNRHGVPYNNVQYALKGLAFLR